MYNYHAWGAPVYRTRATCTMEVHVHKYIVLCASYEEMYICTVYKYQPTLLSSIKIEDPCARLATGALCMSLAVVIHCTSGVVPRRF